MQYGVLYVEIYEHVIQRYILYIYVSTFIAKIVFNSTKIELVFHWDWWMYTEAKNYVLPIVQKVLSTYVGN